MPTTDATRAADAAARGAQVSVTCGHTADAARRAAAVWAAVWPRPNGEPPVSPELARALAHAGNYVSLAQRGDRVIGAALAFRGADALGPLLHSHIAGVLPELQTGGVGRAIKLHQRAWALAEGITRITWTFDPLVARNGYFNLNRLGAEMVEYLVDFYGPMNDGINDGQETDRGLVVWTLDSEPATAAADGRTPAPAPAELPLVLWPDAGGWPVSRPLGDDPLIAVQIPDDIVAVRRDDAARAAAWRKQLRDVMVDALTRGWVVRGATRDGRYVLSRT